MLKSWIKFLIVFVFNILLVSGSCFAQTPVLQLPDLTHWEIKSFEGNTQYDVIEDQSRPVLKAQTKANASGLFREINVDLTETPFLNWRWRVENIYSNIDEKSKSGDDYPARIYIVVSGGLFFWQTRALNYVWSSTQPQGSHWPNAFTSNAILVAVESGADKAGQWVTEKRNVQEDLKKFFGKDVNTINAIAIMSDSDNSKQSATAYYGDIFFSTD